MYSAGMTGYDYVVVFPNAVETPLASKLTLEADVMTPHVLYVMADVIGQLVDTEYINNLENCTNEIAYEGTAMSELIAFYTPNYTTDQTQAGFPMHKYYV